MVSTRQTSGFNKHSTFLLRFTLEQCLCLYFSQKGLINLGPLGHLPSWYLCPQVGVSKECYYVNWLIQITFLPSCSVLMTALLGSRRDLGAQVYLHPLIPTWFLRVLDKNNSILVLSDIFLWNIISSFIMLL